VAWHALFTLRVLPLNLPNKQRSLMLLLLALHKQMWSVYLLQIIMSSWWL
jgi:hypothetical protein